MAEFFGKYRGRVENNLDPLNLGRLQVSVPAVLGDGRLSWAMPCVPYAGPSVGLFAIPPVGANLWVEFEAGDPDHPIWSGAFWAAGQVPVNPALPDVKVLSTAGTTITISDLPGGGVTIEVGPPATPIPYKLVVNAQGLEVAVAPCALKLSPGVAEFSLGAASVKLNPASVSINNGALEVT
jgi:type VI secretion system (T6SS) baseplate-like injector VgrG